MQEIERLRAIGIAVFLFVLGAAVDWLLGKVRDRFGVRGEVVDMPTEFDDRMR